MSSSSVNSGTVNRRKTTKTIAVMTRIQSEVFLDLLGSNISGQLESHIDPLRHRVVQLCNMYVYIYFKQNRHEKLGA